MNTETPLSDDELERYSRHLVIPEVGLEGQQKLRAASVLVVGAGGLGSPVIQYLAAAGIGTIGIIDFDVVDKSNLQRQVLFSTEDVGHFKADVACGRAAKLNPNISVHPYRNKLDVTNVVELFEDYAVIVDGSDNFETRYLINDACVLLKKPNIHGAVHRFEGQVSVFSTEGGPCYRCVFSSAPEPGAVLNCAEAGVLGVLPGIVGTIQATECIKLLLSIGTSLVGKLMIIDGLEMAFRTINIKRDPNCVSCSDERAIKSTDDLSTWHVATKSTCSSNTSQVPAELLTPTQLAPQQLMPQQLSPQQLSPQELFSELASSASLYVIDVRELREYEHSHLENAIHLPLSTLTQNLSEIPNQANVVVYCKSGARSQKAADILKRAGIQNVRNLKGGLSAWSKQIDISMSVL